MLNTFQKQKIDKNDLYIKVEEIKKIEKLLKNKWHDCKLYIYGSIACNLGIKTSDLDISLVSSNIEFNEKNALQDMYEILSKESYSVKKITTAKVPVLKIIDIKKNFFCDISINNKMGLSNTVIIRKISEKCSIFRQLVFAIKHWSTSRDINNPANGTLSSFGIIIY